MSWNFLGAPREGQVASGYACVGFPSCFNAPANLRGRVTTLKLGMHGPIFLNIVCANTGSFVRAPRGGKAALENARVALSSSTMRGQPPEWAGAEKIITQMQRRAPYRL